MTKDLNRCFSISLRSGKIESGPPLSTILGNFGITTVKFVKEFNEFTNDLPDYFLLEIVIYVYNDRTYSFIVKEPNLSLFLKLASFDKNFLVKGSGGYRPQKYRVIKLNDIITIAFLKFNVCDNRTLKLVFSTAFSLGFYVIK